MRCGEKKDVHEVPQNECEEKCRNKGNVNNTRIRVFFLLWFLGRVDVIPPSFAFLFQNPGIDVGLCTFPLALLCTAATTKPSWVCSFLFDSSTILSSFVWAPKKEVKKRAKLKTASKQWMNRRMNGGRKKESWDSIRHISMELKSQSKSNSIAIWWR